MSITRTVLAVAGVATTALTLFGCGKETQDAQSVAPPSVTSIYSSTDLVERWDGGVSAPRELQFWARAADLESPSPVKPQYANGGILTVSRFGTQCRTVISRDSDNPQPGYNVYFAALHEGDQTPRFDGAIGTHVYHDVDGSLTRAAVAKYGAACGVGGS